MEEPKKKSRPEKRPKMSISSDVFRTNIGGRYADQQIPQPSQSRAPARAPRADVPVSSSALGHSDGKFSESDEDNMVVYVGKRKMKLERTGPPRRKQRSAAGETETGKKKLKNERPTHPRRKGKSAGGEKEKDPNVKRGLRTIGKSNKNKRGKRPTKAKLEDWGESAAAAAGMREWRFRPPFKKTPPIRGLCTQWADFWTRYPLRFIRFIPSVLMYVFWTWMFLNLLQSPSGANTSSWSTKKYCVVSKWTRIDGTSNTDGLNYAYDDLGAAYDNSATVVVRLKVYGPFLNVEEQKLVTDNKYKNFDVVIERWVYNSPSSYNRNSFNATTGKTVVKPTAAQGFVRAEAIDTPKTFKMKELIRQHERTTLDYTDFPREEELQLSTSTLKSDQKAIWVLGFGVKTEVVDSIPFSYKVQQDPLTVKQKVLYCFMPLFVFITCLVCEVNRAISAVFAVVSCVVLFPNVGLVTRDTSPANYLMIVNKYFDYDYIFFITAILLLGTLITETNIQSFAAYHILKKFNMELIPVLIFINVVPAVLCYGINNILVTELMIPLVMSLFELMGHDATPGLINMVMVCNMMGRASVGTYASSVMLKHASAELSELDATALLDVGWPAIVVTAVLSVLYILLFVYVKPHQFTRMRQIEENEHNMRFCDVEYATIPDVSKGWHRVRVKLQGAKSFYAYEIKELRARFRKYGPEPEKDIYTRLAELKPKCMITNRYLLLKCAYILCVFLVLTEYYQLNKNLYKVTDEEKRKYLKEDFRLGYIGLFIILLSLLAVHSRDLESLMKRIDWETIIVMACLTYISNFFTSICSSLPSHLLTTYGTALKADKKRDIHSTVVKVLALTAVSGICNEFTIFSMFIDSVYEFSVPAKLNAKETVLAAFFIGTGFWGMASSVGTTPNLVLMGQCYSQGYHHRLRFFKFMLWGLPTAVMSVFLLYWVLIVRVYLNI